MIKEIQMITNLKAKQLTWKIISTILFVSMLISASTRSVPFDSNQEIQRAEMLEIAEQYANYAWTATENNVFHPNLSYANRYILDSSGNPIPVDTALAAYIDTPDYVTSEGQANFGWWTYGNNQGIPYAWGGSTTIDAINLPNRASNGVSFADRIARGYPAGDTSTPWDEFETFYTTGVDCVGLINNAWRMGTRVGMSALHDIYTRPIKFKDLRAGDILMYEEDHVMLFKE